MNNIKTILVAEENRKINRLIAYFLTREGYKTISVYDGRTALRAMEEKTIDAAIIDTMLPFLDGLQVLKQIRQANPYLPAVMLSLKTREADRGISLKLGANDYIRKPFELQDLVGRLKKAVGDQ